MILVEVPVDHDVYVRVSAVPRVVVGPVFMYYCLSSFHSQLSKTSLRFGIVNVQINVYIPDLWVLVGFLDQE